MLCRTSSLADAARGAGKRTASRLFCEGLVDARRFVDVDPLPEMDLSPDADVAVAETLVVPVRR